MRRNESCNRLVLHDGQSGRKFVVRPIIVLCRRWADDLNVYSHRVHIGQSGIDLCQLGEGLRQHHRVVVINGRLSHGASREFRFCLLFRPAGHQILNSQRQSVAVHVDSQMVMPASASVDPLTRLGVAAGQTV